MTKAAAAAPSDRARRRELVTLSVITASALTLAGSWLGIAASDAARAGSTWTIQAPAQATSVVQAGVEAPPATGALQPAPAPTRQVVVVRRSRAS